MNKYYNACLSGCLLLTVLGCSIESSEGEQFSIDSSESYTMDEQGYVPAYPEGWRSGSLFMTLKISQSGDTVEENNSQGGTKTSTKWDYNLNLTHSFPVMLPPDFTLVLPDYDAASIDSAALEDVYIALDNMEPVTQGVVTYNGRMEVLKPRANDVVFLNQSVAAQGEINEVNVFFIRPSSVGKGFEADLNFAYKMQGSSKTTAKYQNGVVQDYDTECCESEPQHQGFFPDPDLSIAQRIIYPVDENLPTELAESYRQMTLDRVTGLQKISTNIEPRAFHHPGMRWVAEPNQLKLHYHSESDNLLSQGGMLAMAAPAAQRSYTLEITLKAN